MSVILQIDFPFNGPFGTAMADVMADLAASINTEPGFQWKIWTENVDSQRAGGIYLFDNAAHAQAYLEKHSQRLASFGVSGIQAQIFAYNPALSALNRAQFLS